MHHSQAYKLIDKAFVNGQWILAQSGKVFTVSDPATCKVISSVPDMSVTDVSLAVDAASEAFESWKETTSKERSIILRKWYDLLVQNQDELARLITLEAGKPMKESVGEVAYGNGFVEWFAEEAKRTYGEVIPSPIKTRELVVLRQPIGPVGLITPWNFPYAMITRKVAPALAAGCTCVIKPAEDTPFTALALAELANMAGFPKGVFNVVTSSSNVPAIGKFLCDSPKIAGISFTGSTEVGKLLYQQCAKYVKRIALELGGNAPFIVFSSANLEKALDGAMNSKFRNCGQTCVSSNRFLIQEGIFDVFVEKLSKRIESTLIIGDGKNESCNLGPLINRNQVDVVEGIVQDAINKGGKIVTGGKRATEVGELFYEPTVITNVTADMKCYTEEIFGPVVVCIKFSSEEECIEVANSTRRGLAGYFYTDELAQAWRVARKLEMGMVGVNEGLISQVEAPFGGIKESGIGREGSRHGMDEYTYLKYVCFGNL